MEYLENLEKISNWLITLEKNKTFSKIFYFEKEYNMQIISSNFKTNFFKETCSFDEYTSSIYIFINYMDNLKKVLQKFLKQKCKKIILSRTKDCAKNMNLSINKISIKDQKTLWGSCSKKGNINLNWRLCLCPLLVLDYVIIHELAHLVHFNHSKIFWKLVEKYMQNYEIAKKWLKINEKLIINI